MYSGEKNGNISRNQEVCHVSFTYLDLLWDMCNNF